MKRAINAFLALTMGQAIQAALATVAVLTILAVLAVGAATILGMNPSSAQALVCRGVSHG